MVQQQVSYQAHFEIYAFVDLGAGTFADPETDLLEDERWADLRVAVAEQKGIDPYRVVFLAMLSDESFFASPDWYFDLAMGTLFDELESITKEQIRIDELGYEDEDGNEVMGEEVIADVIEQGSQLAQGTERSSGLQSGCSRRRDHHHHGLSRWWLALVKKNGINSVAKTTGGSQFFHLHQFFLEV